MGEQPANDDKKMGGGQRNSAAQPVTDHEAAPEPFPPVGKDDSVETAQPTPGEARTFDVEMERPEREAEADSSAAVPHDHTGPAADPAEGKR